MTNEKNSSELWLGFILGAIFGLGLTYFFGTKSGRKILKDILSTIEDLEEPLKKSFSSFISELHDLLEDSDLKTLIKEENNNDKKHISNGSTTILLNKIKGAIRG